MRCKHKDTAPLVLIRQVGSNQDGEEGRHVRWDGQQVGVYLGVAEGGDDSWEAKGERVDGRDDGEKVYGQEDRVPV